MPTLSIWSGRLALIYLVAGWALGAVMMMNRAWNWSAHILDLLPIHGALLLFGWTLQLVICVAYWILPTFGGRDNRGREWAAWLSVIAVNSGVLLAIFSPLLPRILLPASALFWLLSVLAFGHHLWPRIKAFGRG